ncbi:glutathione peroxidase [Acuticoccus mangrovi]|uniref:Glutathione peroxidase n=1 Tax=Acuticoccus mangrovi TaxID=2796142 RepID=A0A934IUI5_9HYPH|nr:glutathione peroxidase [Acuticoccus mangrovi]MBJ3778823.1 glutathione peroxidase [Acuticoccus mangrovi]
MRRALTAGRRGIATGGTGIAAAAGLALALVASLTARGHADTVAPLAWQSLRLTDIHGEPVDGGRFAGRVVLLVNTASRCAFTPQYDGLEALWREEGRAGLVVLGVPSNDFGGQEPGSNAEIAQFCTSTYRVSFPMLQKAKVTGKAAHPLFQWARQAGGRAAVPAWNFHKILIGRDGRFVAAFPSFVSPRAPEVEAAVGRALATPAL